MDTELYARSAMSSRVAITPAEDARIYVREA
jgi:hypothetical protein